MKIVTGMIISFESNPLASSVSNLDDRRIPRRIHTHRSAYPERYGKCVRGTDWLGSYELDQLHNAPMGIRRTARVYTANNGAHGVCRSLRSIKR